MKYKDIFIDLDNTIYDTKALKSGIAIEGAYELLDFLRSEGCRLHICSNGSLQGRLEKLHALHLEDAFDNIICSEKAEAEKPDREFFEYALRMTDAKPETTLMIGDNYDTDIIGAEAIGIDTLLYNRWEADWMPPGPVTYRVNKLTDIKKIWQR